MAAQGQGQTQGQSQSSGSIMQQQQNYYKQYEHPTTTFGGPSRLEMATPKKAAFDPSQIKF